MPAVDSFSTNKAGLSSPYEHAAVITKHDTNELAYVTRAIWVGGTGDMRVLTISGEDVLISSIPDGNLIPIRVKKVFSTNTSASNMIALW